MSDASVSTLKRRLAIAGVALVFLAACADSGAGCGEEGCGNVPYPVAGPVIDRAVQARLTPQGFAFIEDNAAPIIDEVMGGEGLSFCVPPVNQSGFLVCNNPTVNQCTGGSPGCQFDATLDHLEINPIEPEATGDPSLLSVTVVLTDIEEMVPLEQPVLGQCNHLQISSDAFHIEVEVIFNIDPVTDRTSVVLDNINIHVEDLEYTSTATIGDPDYTACSLDATALGILGPMLAGFLADPIEEMVNQYLCLSCDPEGDCPPLSYCDTDESICMYDSTTCVPLPLGLEGELDLPTMLQSVRPTQENKLNYLFYMATYADAEDDGMSLGAQVGTFAEHDNCVPPQPAPSGAVAKSDELVSDLTPASTTYMLGIGISELALETALWSFYQSGALCLSVGTDMVEQLSSGALALLLRSLPELTEGENVPVFMHLRPTQAPTVTLGSGEVSSADPPEIIEPLITLEIDEMFIDFYLYMEERYVRLFSLETDLEVPVALSPSDDHTSIELLLGDLTDAVTRVVPHHAEIISEDDTRLLVALLPVLIAGATPLLEQYLAEPFELPELMGYRIVLDENSFTSIEDDTMLAVFANLEPAPEPEEKRGRDDIDSDFRPRAMARVAAMTGPDPETITRFESQRMRGNVVDLDDLQTEVLLAVDTIDSGEGEREYTYRIDGGPWHLYRPAGEMWIRDAAFLLEGTHTIEVRSRVPGVPDTGSLISEPVAITIDLSSPRVRLYRADYREIEVQARDNVWPSHQLTMRYRLDGGQWSDAGPVRSIRLPLPGSGAETVQLEVEVTDPLGRSKTDRQTFALRRAPMGDVEPLSEPSGCTTVAPEAGNRGLGFWLALLPAMLVWLGSRRRSRRSRNGRFARVSVIGFLLAAVTALGLVAMGCADEEPADTTPHCTGCDNCGADEMCRDNCCVPNVCGGDSDCPEGMVCVGDRCVVRTSCTDDTVCPENQFCIDDDEDGGSECLSVPCEDRSACAFISCEGGEVPMCFDGSCVCEIPCAEGCGEDEFCCYATNSCIALPTACEDLDCDAGYGPVVVTEASGDPDSCEITGPDCECQPLPPLPLGDIGSYLSAAAGPGGVLYVSAYNRTYGDLMVGVAGTDDEIEWMFIDGLPDSGEIVGNLEGPRGGIGEPGPEAGRYSSIVVGADGVIHVSYFHRYYRDLRYARGVNVAGDWYWTISLVDDSDWSGMYTDITLSSTGVPGIAYFVGRAEISPGIWYSQVKYAWADAPDPSTWTVEMVDSGYLDVACGGPCSGTRQCNAYTNRCERVTDNSACSPACTGEMVCFEGETSNSCAPVIAQPELVTLHAGMGLFVDSARFSNNDVGVVYYDHDFGDVRYSRSAGNTFNGAVPQVIDSEGDVGWYPAITITDDDSVHLTYFDATNWDLKYFQVGTERAEVVDTGIRGIGENLEQVLAGYDSSLVILGDGTLQVAYMDASLHDVLLINRSLESGWQAPRVVMGDEDPYQGAYGFYLNQLLIDDTVVLLSYRINTREAVRDVAIHRVE